MAKKVFLVDLDLASNELQNAQVQNLTSDPTSPGVDDKGWIIYNTTENKFKVWNGTQWDTLTTDGGGSYVEAPSNLPDGELIQGTGTNGVETSGIKSTNVALKDTDFETSLTGAVKGLTTSEAKTAVSASNKLITESDLGSAGLGDVVGPATSVINNISTYATVNGKTIKDSGVSINDVATKTEVNTVQSNLDTHTGDTNNPHSVTYAQLPDKPTIPTIPTDNITGSGIAGTMTKFTGTKVIGNSSVTETQVAGAVSHVGRTDNPHVVTKEQVGLGNVDNTSDADKPISNAQATENAKFLKKDGTVKLTADWLDNTKDVGFKGLALTGKATSAATIGTDSDSTLTTKGYVDGVVAGGVNFKGGYNATTNKVSSGDNVGDSLIGTHTNAGKHGDMYEVTTAGTQCGSNLEKGDVLILNQDVPVGTAYVCTHWTMVQKNVDLATTTTAGIVELATGTETSAGTSQSLAVTPYSMHYTIREKALTSGMIIPLTGGSTTEVISTSPLQDTVLDMVFRDDNNTVHELSWKNTGAGQYTITSNFNMPTNLKAYVTGVHTSYI